MYDKMDFYNEVIGLLDFQFHRQNLLSEIHNKPKPSWRDIFQAAANWCEEIIAGCGEEFQAGGFYKSESEYLDQVAHYLRVRNIFLSGCDRIEYF